MRDIPPHEREAGGIEPEELRDEMRTLELVERQGRPRGRPFLRIPDEWSQDPRIQPADLTAEITALDRLASA
ncbi:MAG: hypothetical protein HY744_12280 [Deltaproteobacteria bacterium]|nr:hypothetical protein [Deltaproteobacteria bacterium]